MDILQEIEHVAKQLPGESLESVMAGFTAYGTSDHYNLWLNLMYCETEICGCKYSPAHAFKAVDPIAYQYVYEDYFRSLLDGGFVEYNGLAYRVEDLEEWLDNHEELRAKEIDDDNKE